MALFSTAVSDATASLFDLPAFWQQLIAIEHPGPAPDLTATGRRSPSCRRLRAVSYGNVPGMGRWRFFVAIIPAGLSFSVDLPILGRMFFFIAAIALYVLIRLVLRSTVDATAFVVREHDCRRLWETTLAEWEAKAGPRKFDDKRRELEKLKDWWAEAAGQPQQRSRIEAAIRRAFQRPAGEREPDPVRAHVAARECRGDLRAPAPDPARPRGRAEEKMRTTAGTVLATVEID